MAKLSVNAKITAPTEINIPLIRADVASISDIFRMFFELFMSLFFCILGFILGQVEITIFEWTTLTFTAILTIIFLVISYKVRKKS